MESRAAPQTASHSRKSMRSRSSTVAPPSIMSTTTPLMAAVPTSMSWAMNLPAEEHTRVACVLGEISEKVYKGTKLSFIHDGGGCL